MNRPPILLVIVACHAITCGRAGVHVDTSHHPPTHSHSTTPQNETTLFNHTTPQSYNSTLNDSPWDTEGDLEEDPLPPTLIYEIYPSADEIINNNTRCSHTQLAFTKETLLHVWNIKGLIGYISYIKRFDQPFEVNTDYVSFKSDNVDGKWSFKVHKVRHHSPFSSLHSSSSVLPVSAATTTNSAATSSNFVPGGGAPGQGGSSSDIGDIRLIATYSYEAKQSRNIDFIIKPTILHGSKEIPLPPQKSTSPTIIQQKFYNTRGYQLNTNFLEYVYTFTWVNLMQPLKEIKNGLFTSQLPNFEEGTQADEPPPPPPKPQNHQNYNHDEASEEFFEEITRTDFSGHFGDVTLKFVIQAYIPSVPVSVTSSRCNSSFLDAIISPNLLEKLVASPSGGKSKDHHHHHHRHHHLSSRQGNPPYLRYANSMIYDDRFTDVILVVGAAADEIPAHRIILATSSPVFSELLENTTLTLVTPQLSQVTPIVSSSSSSSSSSSTSTEDFQASPSSSSSSTSSGCDPQNTQVHLPRIQIDIPDVTVQGVEELLRYIYTGSVDNLKMKSGNLANQLIVLADKYDLTELKRHCENILLRELTADNAIEMYLLATRVSSARVTRKALIVMKMNKARLASQTEEFRELSMQHPTLMYELFLSD